MTRCLPFLVFSFATFFSFTAAFRYKTDCKRPNETSIVHVGNSVDLRSVYNDLVTCPNITTLHIHLTMMGCDVPREPWHFEFRKGDRFPALRKLSLCGYDFEEIPFPDAWTMEGTWEYTAYQAFSKVKSFLTPSGLAVRGECQVAVGRLTERKSADMMA